MKKMLIKITVFMLTLICSFSSTVFAEEIVQETTKMYEESYENESDETIEYLKHNVTFVDEQRNTKQIVEVQHSRRVSEIVVSDEPIKYKGNKLQKFVYWGTKKGNTYKKYDFTTSVKKDITVYAVYAVIQESNEKKLCRKRSFL
jgi:hypothetical protein